MIFELSIYLQRVLTEVGQSTKILLSKDDVLNDVTIDKFFLYI
jgi:hypothetical protein